MEERETPTGPEPSPSESLATDKFAGRTLGAGCVAGIVLLVGVVLIPGFGRVANGRRISQRIECLENLQQIQGACKMWAQEHSDVASRRPPDWKDLVGADSYLRGQPMCPGGGTYKIGKTSAGWGPTCSIASHSHSAS